MIQNLWRSFENAAESAPLAAHGQHFRWRKAEKILNAQSKKTII